MEVKKIEAEPGFFVCETIPYCGRGIDGGSARTVNLTCVNTGWTFTISVPSDGSGSLVAALDAAQAAVPIEVIALHIGGASRDRSVIDWATKRNVLLPRRLPGGPGRRSLRSNVHQLVRRQPSQQRYDLVSIN